MLKLGRRVASAFLAAVCSLAPVAIWAAPDDGARATLSAQLDAMFNRHEYEGKGVQLAWQKEGAIYTILEPAAGSGQAAGSGRRKGRDIVAYDTATGARTVLIAAAKLIPPGASEPLSIRGLLVVQRPQEAADFYQRQEGLAAAHARRLLGIRRGHRQADQAGRQGAGVVADVCHFLAGFNQGCVGGGTQPVRGRPGHGEDHAIDDGWIGRHYQRHFRLGERGGIRSAQLLPLEPGFRVDRVLAIRSVWGGHLHADQRHGSGVSEAIRVQVPAAGDDQLGGASGRGGGGGRADEMDGAGGRPAAALHCADAVGRQLARVDDRVPGPIAAARSIAAGRCGDGTGEAVLRRCGQGVGECSAH